MNPAEKIALEEVMPSDVDSRKTPLPRYRDNAIDGFRNGALLDLRVRWAHDLLLAPLFHGAAAVTPPEFVAEQALDIATALLDAAEARGLVEPFRPYEQDKTLQGHVDRQVDFQLAGQAIAAKRQREAAGVVHAPGSAVPFSPRTN